MKRSKRAETISPLTSPISKTTRIERVGRANIECIENKYFHAIPIFTYDRPRGTIIIRNKNSILTPLPPVTTVDKYSPRSSSRIRPATRNAWPKLCVPINPETVANNQGRRLGEILEERFLKNCSFEIAIEYNINKSCKNIYKYDDILLDEIKLKIER